MFEAMATARPIVLGVMGESACVLEAAGAGMAIPPEDSKALAQALQSLAAAPGHAEALGKRGRQYVEREFDRERLAEAMLNALRAVAAKGHADN
jgi:colanic acid biosynthesis glycosyl transferase WcaI